MSKKLKRQLRKIIIGVIAIAIAVFIDLIFPSIKGGIIEIGLFIVAYVIIGGDVVKKAIVNILHGQVLDENFLMFIATIGAFIIGEYPEAVSVMLFYQVGEWFQSFAVNRSRKSIKDLMDIRPDYANVLRNDEELEVDPSEVAIGEYIIIKPGEKIPLDGVVIKGNSSLDTKALTGESVAREVLVGDEVISGCVNITGVITVEVQKEFANSTVSKILDLVENASSKKAKAENYISKFAKYYTPSVVVLAVILAFLPPIILGEGLSIWVYRALSFLVISCPCALVISVPMSLFGGLGGASKSGILIKGGNYLEILSEAEIVVMDKTGTLTEGTFVVEKLYPISGVSEEELLEAASYAESYSNHPISISLQAAYGKEINRDLLQEVEEIPGHGVKANIDGKMIFVGNDKLMSSIGVKSMETTDVGTIVHVASSDKYLGYIIINDKLKKDAKECVIKLKAAGIKKIIMLTGDRKEVADHVANELGINEVHSELLPQDKVAIVEDIFARLSKKGKLIFVGDGINDAPVLARADIGIAMGGLGSDAAIEAADVVIMNDAPSKIATAMQISNKTLSIVKQNIIFALGVKLVVLILAAIGIATMWAAVFADVGVAVIAILNAMRAMTVRESN